MASLVQVLMQACHSPASTALQSSPGPNIFDKCCQVWGVDGGRVVRMCFLHPINLSRAAVSFGCASDDLHGQESPLGYHLDLLAAQRNKAEAIL